MDDGYGFGGVDEATIRQERSKARELRRSRWWKQKIAQRRCHYCGRETEMEELTMDHIVPLARGGRSAKNNLVPACKECNNLKKTLLPMEWQEYMDRLERQ
ncbi:MAG: HNH endonuclease [Desulfobulbaceae bacterium]|nr:HNH endonuclease [Desulfobulbaceae bacterium]